MTWGVPRPRPPLLDDAAFQVPSLNVPALPPMAMAVQQTAPKPKFFGQGGMGRTIAGLIGDVLLQRGGNSPLFAPTMLKRRELEAEDAREQAKIEREERRDIAKTEAAERARLQGRNEGLQDWLWKQNWELQNKPQFTAVDVTDPATGVVRREYVQVPRAGQSVPQGAPAVLDQLPPNARPLSRGGAGSQAPRSFR